MNQFFWLVWDVLAVLLLLYFTNSGARKGFVRTVVNCAGYFVAIYLAKTFSPQLSQMAYDGFVRQLFAKVLEQKIEQAGFYQDAAELLEAMPTFLKALLQWAQQEASLVALPKAPAEAAALLMDSVLEHPLLSFLQSVSFLLVFSLGLFITRRFSYLMGGLYRVPVLGFFNTFLGGITGLVQGILALFVCVLLLHAILILSGDSLAFLNSGVLDKTFVVRAFLRVISP